MEDLKMKANSEDYERFAQLVNDGEVWREEKLTFRRLCRREGLDAIGLELALIAEFGMDGDEVMDCYRRNCRVRGQ